MSYYLGMNPPIGTIWKKSYAAFSALCRWLLKLLIDAYVVVLSPHIGGRCRFHPSCSVYAREALDVHGPFHGSALMVRRLVKCGPWHPGGEDPVPANVHLEASN